MKKLILASLSMILIGLICWFVLTPQKQPFPPRVALPDGTSLRILAVTYGTNHVVGTKLAHLTARLPPALQNILQSILGQRAMPVQTMTTSTPELVVWVQHQTNTTSTAATGGAYFTAVLGDGTNFTSGAEAFFNSGFPSPLPAEALQFGVFPRRDRQVTLNIFYHPSTGGVRLCNSLSFANPLDQNYPQWQPEPLPATKRAGGVEASLQGFETGHDSSSSSSGRNDGKSIVTYGTDRRDGRNHTAVDLKLRPLSNTNEIWQVADVEISDATGNTTHSSSMSWQGDSPGFAFAPGLWLGETAWKLKLNLKRSAGFRPEELFTFKNVPLGEPNRTNTIAWSTNIAGVTITLQSICRRAPLTNNTWSSTQTSTIHLTHSSLPAGVQLDLLRMVCDTGKTNHSESWSSSSNERDYNFHDIPLDAQTADFTFALQQSQTVEFTIKPQLAEVKKEAAK